MARTKKTLQANRHNPPEDLLCGFCGYGAKRGNKKMLETLKLCGVCKESFPVHVKCARQLFKHVAKKNETFEETKTRHDLIFLIC